MPRHLTEFVDDFRTQTKQSFFSLYDKNEIIQYMKKLGVDVTPRNTKDELYKRLQNRITETDYFRPPSFTILRGG